MLADLGPAAESLIVALPVGTIATVVATALVKLRSINAWRDVELKKVEAQTARIEGVLNFASARTQVEDLPATLRAVSPFPVDATGPPVSPAPDISLSTLIAPGGSVAPGVQSITGRTDHAHHHF